MRQEHFERLPGMSDSRMECKNPSGDREETATEQRARSRHAPAQKAASAMGEGLDAVLKVREDDRARKHRKDDPATKHRTPDK